MKPISLFVSMQVYQTEQKAVNAFPHDRSCPQIMHSSFADPGFLNMHNEHVHSPSVTGPAFVGTSIGPNADNWELGGFTGATLAPEEAGAAAMAERLKAKFSMGRRSASIRMALEGIGELSEILNVKNGRAGFAIFSALSIADR